MSAWKKIKNYFVAGLIAILPLWITYAILRLVFKLTAGVARPFLKDVPGLSSNAFLLDFVSCLGTVSIILFLGLLLTNMLGRRLFQIVEKIFHKIPLLSWLYVSIRKLTSLFYQEDGLNQIRRVVMVEYPRKGIYVLGFLTANVIDEINEKVDKVLVNVFLPTTPNPTSGFLLLVPKEDIIPLEMSVEDAVKLIVSGGISTPGGDSDAVES